MQKLQSEIEKKQGIYYEFDVHSKPIGVGGMGKVYLGFKVVEESGKKTPVAIKAMYEDLPEHIIERARRESSIQIKHENLVEMLGFVEKNDLNSTGGNIKHYHVISEYINGVSLNDILCGMVKNQFGVELESAKKLYDDYKKDRLKVSLKIVGQVLSAIMALHDNGYIHRDIDPSNIMITAKGNVKLIDFGIAKRRNALGSQDKSLTSTGIFIGKAQYAAPELVTGDVKHQDVTTDIYAVGILFYQLLVGALPFNGPIPEILDAQLHKKLPVKNIENKECREIVKKATEKKIIDRYKSSAEFRVAIDNIKINPDINKKKIIYTIVPLMIIIGLLLLVKFILYPPTPPIDHDIPDIIDDTTNIIHIKTAIHSDIAYTFRVSEFDYDGLMKIANEYYNCIKVSDEYKYMGNCLINSEYGTSLLEMCGNDTNYSNIKVAFILYVELRAISIKNNNKILQKKCDDILSKIKDTSTLYIK